MQFGDDDQDEQPQRSRGRSESSTPASATTPANPLEYPEEEGDDVQVQETVVNLPLPKYPRLQPTDGKVWQLKLPAYVNLESRPYDSDYYRETVDEPEEIEGRKKIAAARAKMLLVKNTIRWKWVTGPDGEPVRQSNARMVRWSDGSMSLKVGADLFDVAPSHGATLARPQDLEASGQKAPEQSTSISSTTFVCVPAQHERVLETETAIAGQLTLVPTSGTSKTHIELVRHVGQQHVKHARMKVLDDTEDRATINKLYLKASETEVKVAKPKAKKTGGHGTSSGGSRSRRFSRRAASYDSGSDEGYGSKKQSAGGYDEEDDFVVADDDEDEARETDDDDDAAYGSQKKKSKSSRKRKGSEESLDEMELAERRIEQRERERKRAKKEKSKQSRDYIDTDEDEEDAEGEPDAEAEGEAEEEDMEMDVESEED